eukprot:TRINITY_DN52008_c0_g1_i1.p1 TRINITY_DN52008_c0_g1~~TRINITY_DN52008_c0_g1_i1.p1  ORF type:complete len:437 (+),score=160.69 TRINITY_DN52008_c0_g1_i1:94-1311(+)
MRARAAAAGAPRRTPWRGQRRGLIGMHWGDPRYPLVKKWTTPVSERFSQHPYLDEPVITEYDKGTFCMYNERYPSVERVCDQFFPGLFPRTKEDFEELAAKDGNMTTEELMLEHIGLWNITMLLREYGSGHYTGAKLATPMEWEVAGIQDLLPEYYSAFRKMATNIMRFWYSFLYAELVVASPKYKIGGILPLAFHITEGGPRRFGLVYISCHPEFGIYPEVGEQRYAREPLDFLLYSQLNYYHVLLNMYKWIFVQEGWTEPQDAVTMALCNFALQGDGTVKSTLYSIQTDDRVREALEMRFAGVGPAAEMLAPEWFDRKDLWREEELNTAANAKDREQMATVRRERSEFLRWKEQMDSMDDEFKNYLVQQQKELAEDQQKLSWRIKNRIWRFMGGQGPYTRDMI